MWTGVLMILVKRFGTVYKFEDEEYEALKEKLETFDIDNDKEKAQELREILSDFYEIIQDSVKADDMAEYLDYDLLTQMRFRDMLLVEKYLKEKGMFHND